ncbi:MAG: phosphoribosylformylglycinamidine cyclo-ligase [Deltaproteobacteria bacterium]|nr:phosphoribosylformylglycinamidine cyclo-ligase [Deltaproteobacteria bacterium]
MASQSEKTGKGLTYRDAGVDIDAGEALVERIRSHVKRTLRPEVIGGLGGFAGLCGLPKGYKNPLLVACTDGVGTKLKLAFLMNKHDTVGIDLVAMNVNDLVVGGGEPLLFLDYFAVGRLDVGVAEQVISGIADGCKQAGCALIGGETAELPGFYADGEYDLAGFCVGVVEKDKIVDGTTLEPGDVLLGLGSTGFHSNGYSLVRRVFLEEVRLDLGSRVDELGCTLGEALLRPTRIYVRGLRRLAASGLMKGAAHITGGGLVENPTRMVPAQAKLKLQINLGAWPVPPLFSMLARLGKVAPAEMRRTFNMGIGMIVAVPAGAVDAAQSILELEGEKVFAIGTVLRADQPDAPVEFVS